jgi:Zn finger protein HypA/HybF involved in hydrogenase expression
MHEWSIVEETVKEILNLAKENGMKKINKVRLLMGRDLEEDSVRFCFGCLAKGILFEGCQLEIQRTNGTGITIQHVEGI